MVIIFQRSFQGIFTSSSSILNVFPKKCVRNDFQYKCTCIYFYLHYSYLCIKFKAFKK